MVQRTRLCLLVGLKSIGVSLADDLSTGVLNTTLHVHAQPEVLSARVDLATRISGNKAKAKRDLGLTRQRSTARSTQKDFTSVHVVCAVAWQHEGTLELDTRALG